MIKLTNYDFVSMHDIVNNTSPPNSAPLLDQKIIVKETFANHSLDLEIIPTKDQGCIKLSTPCPLKVDFDAALAALQKSQHSHTNLTLLETITQADIDRWNSQTSSGPIQSVQPEFFTISSTHELCLNDLPASKIVGLINQQGQVISLSQALDEKVTKETGKGLSSNDFTDILYNKLVGIEDNAQVNRIEIIKFNGVALPIAADKSVDLSKSFDTMIATPNTAGLVKSTDPIIDSDGNITNSKAIENKVAVKADGTMEVNSLNINKLVQDDDTELILDSGSI